MTDGNIRYGMKFAGASLKYHERGIPLEIIDTHSLHSGGAYTLDLAGYKDQEITKMGRWALGSHAFMEYIQQQLSTFSAGMSAAMSCIKKFINTEGGVTRENLCHLMVF